MDWDEFARPWLASAPALEAAHAQVEDALFRAARLQPGERVLDIGCGTGPSTVEAAHLVGPEGHVTGVDIAPPLVARAGERVPEHVDLIVADAGAHDYDTGAYDAIISNFGTMFFADTGAAFANLRGAVKDDGRLIATVWGPPSHNPWFTGPRAIVDLHVPGLPRPDPAGPGPMRFGDPGGLLDAMAGAGWKAEVDTLDLDLLPPGGPDDVAQLHMTMTAGMALKGQDVPDAALQAIEADLQTACAGLQRADGQIVFPARIHVITATPA